MADSWLAKLRERRRQIERDAEIRLQEIDALIGLAEKTLPRRSAHRTEINRSNGSVAGYEGIFEREVVHAFLGERSLTSKEIEALLPGQRIGPLVNAWIHRAEAAGFVFADLISRAKHRGGVMVFTLTAEGHDMFESVVEMANEMNRAGDGQ